MGVVYRATDTRLNRDVALKVLPPELMTDPQRRDRFVREARAASALEHPHIAVIHDVGEEDGISFIAMELIRGDKLSTAIANGQFAANAGRALDIAVEIAEGLARAHSQGIIHRDLKPANVMLTEDGHAKVIDFGLAKLLAPLSGDGDTVTAGATDPGVIIGTVHYMSPEQARGAAIDHRTDMFAFGVLLYEMFSGMVPFRGQSSIETILAILPSAPPPLRAPALPAAATGDVQRIVDKCLAKDPDDRYQGMKDLIVDLKAARRRLDTASMAAPMPPAAAPKRPAPMLIGMASLVVVAAIALWIWAMPPRAPVAQATSTRPSIAVLHFENNTGNPAMDWLRTGLTDMLVTDLSQSTAVEVLSTDRLVQILRDMGSLEDRTVSFETVQEVARRGRVQHVLLGSYVKAGDAIRINVRLQDAASGRILSTERVDAPNEASLFPTMDDLTRRVRTRFVSTGGNPLTGLLSSPRRKPEHFDLDRDLKDVTTSSMEAYRNYASGIEHHQRGRYLDALPFFQRAVEIDPDFALAYVKMAVGTANVGRSNESEEYGRKAIALVDRLTPRERYYIEGFYHQNGSVYRMQQAIAAYEKAVDLYPDHSSSRNNLAMLLTRVDDFDGALAHYGVLRDRGFEFPGAAGNLASVYITLRRDGDAMEVINDFTNRHPNVESGWMYLGYTHLAAMRLDEAQTAFEKSLALRPGYPPALAGTGQAAIMRDDFARSDELSRTLLGGQTINMRNLGTWNRYLVALYRGRTREALGILDAMVAQYGTTGSNESASARARMAHIHNARGERAAAAAAATLGVADARARNAVVDALFQGSVARSAELRAEYQRFADLVPRGSEKILPSLADAAADLDEGRHQPALDVVQRVLPQLPPGPILPGIPFPVFQPRILAEYIAGRARLALGDSSAAVRHFQTVADAGYLRLFHPVEYVRSLFYLGQIADRQGDRARAREFYSRFLRYWKDGDVDRDQVAEALKKTS